MFADFSFYEEVYHGDLLTEEEFPKFAERADTWLTERTMGRCSRPCLSEMIRISLKKAECAVADALRSSEPTGLSDPAVQKETVGDYSVTYRSSADLDRETAARVCDLITRYLAYTGLLFRGVPICYADTAHCHPCEFPGQ